MNNSLISSLVDTKQSKIRRLLLLCASQLAKPRNDVGWVFFIVCNLLIIRIFIDFDIGSPSKFRADKKNYVII